MEAFGLSKPGQIYVLVRNGELSRIWIELLLAWIGSIFWLIYCIYTPLRQGATAQEKIRSARKLTRKRRRRDDKAAAVRTEKSGVFLSVLHRYR